MFTLGTAYIDDHVKRDAASVYIGVMYAMVAFGPVAGFLLGAYMLKVYVDIFTIDTSKPPIDASSRHWVGMWWGGFLIIGVLALFLLFLWVLRSSSFFLRMFCRLYGILVFRVVFCLLCRHVFLLLIFLLLVIFGGIYLCG